MMRQLFNNHRKKGTMNDRLIIAMTGLAQSGKSTVGERLVQKHSFAQDAFADDLKRAVYAINPLVPTVWIRNRGQMPWQKHERLATLVDRLGWDKAKQLSEVRSMLQHIGTDGGWMIHGEDLWLHGVERRMKALPQETPLVITDCRFPAEYRWVKAHGGFILRVERQDPQQTTRLDGELSGHISENGEIEHDYRVLNNGSVASLYAQVDAVLDMIRIDHASKQD